MRLFEDKHQKDKELAQSVARGDCGACGRLLDQYGPRLQSLARRYTFSREDAEDLTQVIFVEIYRSISRYRGDSALSTWIYGIGLNQCMKHAQLHEPSTEKLEDADLQSPQRSDPEDFAAQTELRDEISSALDRLSPEHKSVVILHELQELTYAECAVVLAIPVGTVKSRLYYAFRALRTTLSDYGQAGRVVVDDSNIGASKSPKRRCYEL